MKRTCTFLTVLMLTLASFTASSASLRGDVNQDGSVTIADVTALIDYLLTGNASAISPENADSNKDGSVGIADVTVLIDRLLTGNWPSEEQNHDYVDLGLPSGTLWATCNVGANSPEDYGDYFAWGETEPKDVYDLTTYKWFSLLSGGYYTKYCTNSIYGPVDYKTELDLADDAAYVNWGSLWRMPSHAQIRELCDNCSWTWTTRNGVKGQSVGGPNGNTMFLPAAGYRYADSHYREGTRGYFWGRIVDSAPCYAFNLYFQSGSELGLGNRYEGQSVRPVRVSQN